MSTAGLFLEPSGSAGSRLQAGRTLELASPVQEGGTSLFRATLHLLVPVDAPCQRITLAAGSGLSLRFEPLTVGVGEHDHAWVTKWEAERDRVTVGLSRPAAITRVRSRIYGRAMLHRVDGDAVASQPTTSVSSGAPLSPPFLAGAFQVAFDQEQPAEVSKIIADYVEERQESHALAAKVRAPGSQPAHAAKDDAWEEARREAVVRSALVGLDVSGSPSSPRLRLLHGDPGEALWLWVNPGEHKEAVRFVAEGQALAEAWEPALERALAKLRQEGPGSLLALPLHLESDAPCRVVVEKATLGFVWEAELLSEPVALRYEGTSVETKLVRLSKPSAAPVRLALAGSVGGLAPLVSCAPPALGATSRYTGAALLEGESLAMALTIGRPLWLAGLALAWAPLSDRIDLRVSLLAEADGQPGAPLIEAGVEVALSEPAWVQCRFPGAPLQPGRYWVRARAAVGRGVWLGAPAAAPGAVWRLDAFGETVASGLPLRLLLEPCEEAPAASSSPPLVLALNGVPLTTTMADPQRFVAQVEPLPPSLGAAQEWNLAATSPQPLAGALQSVRVGYLLA